jgi:hypothetical protein
LRRVGHDTAHRNISGAAAVVSSCKTPASTSYRDAMILPEDATAQSAFANEHPCLSDLHSTGPRQSQHGPGEAPVDVGTRSL